MSKSFPSKSIITIASDDGICSAFSIRTIFLGTVLVALTMFQIRMLVNDPTGISTLRTSSDNYYLIAPDITHTSSNSRSLRTRNDDEFAEDVSHATTSVILSDSESISSLSVSQRTSSSSSSTFHSGQQAKSVHRHDDQSDSDDSHYPTDQQENDIHHQHPTPSNTNTTNVVVTDHNPRRFSDNTEQNILRGMNIINCWSAQRIASWIFVGKKKIRRKQRTWEKRESKRKFVRNIKDMNKIKPNDTIFVPHGKLIEFTERYLPYLTVDVVVISTTFHLMYPQGLVPASRNVTDHPNILHWFVTNPPYYSGGMQDHPKVSSFPLGLKPNMGGASYRNPIPYYRRAFLKYHQIDIRSLNITTSHSYNSTTTKAITKTRTTTKQLPPPSSLATATNSTTTTMNDNMHSKKNTTIYVSPLGKTTAARKRMPKGGKRAPYPKYLEKMAQAYYVLSPDGDHPDCHRHYEAIGLGTIPITQLDPKYYSHLEEGHVIYKNNRWNLGKLQSTLPMPPAHKPNHNMIFEEFWMEYIERRVGIPLRWWDILEGRRRFLENF